MASSRHAGRTQVSPLRKTDNSQIIRNIVTPEITKEVNEGKNFAQLRQVYNSLILATWYKKKIKDSILNQVYADKNKIKGTEYTQSTLPSELATKATKHPREIPQRRRAHLPALPPSLQKRRLQLHQRRTRLQILAKLGPKKVFLRRIRIEYGDAFNDHR